MLISVIMPAYNNEKDISLSISSILLQDHQDFELIIVDDASSDKTNAIINKFAGHDSRIKILNHHENQGRAISRNHAILESSGQLIAILDADDIAMPSRLSIQNNYFAVNADVTILGSSAIRINSNNTTIDMVECSTDKAVLKKQFVTYHKMPFVHSSVTFRRMVLQYAGLYDKKFVRSQDIHFCRRVALAGNVAALPEPLVLYRISNSLSPKIIRQRHFYSAYAALDGYRNRPNIFSLVAVVNHLLKGVMPGFLLVRSSGLLKHQQTCGTSILSAVNTWLIKLTNYANGFK